MKSSIPSLLSAFAAVSLMVACGSAPAKAPGTNPEDMTPEGHRAAADQEKGEAAEHERQAEDVQPTKPAVEDREHSQHEQEADKHKDVAGQHEEAAEAAEAGGGAKPEQKKSK